MFLHWFLFLDLPRDKHGEEGSIRAHFSNHRSVSRAVMGEMTRAAGRRVSNPMSGIETVTRADVRQGSFPAPKLPTQFIPSEQRGQGIQNHPVEHIKPKIGTGVRISNSRENPGRQALSQGVPKPASKVRLTRTMPHRGQAVSSSSALLFLHVYPRHPSNEYHEAAAVVRASTDTSTNCFYGDHCRRARSGRA